MGKETDHLRGLVKSARRLLEVRFHGCVPGEFRFEFVATHDREVDCYAICGFSMLVSGNLLLQACTGRFSSSCRLLHMNSVIG